MPKVERQTNKPAAKAPTPTYKSESEQIDSLRLVAYGRQKTGKTRLFATFPRPSLIIGSEDGTKSICTGKRDKVVLPCGAPIKALTLKGADIGIDFCRLHDSTWWDELLELIVSGGYKSACVDHGGGLQELILKEVCGWAEMPLQGSYGMAQQKDWQVVGARIKERLSHLFNLSDTHGTNVMVIAHERNFNSSEDGSDVMLPSIGAALTPSVAGWLHAAGDYVCQTYIREQTKTQTHMTAGKEVISTVKTGKKEFCLRVGPHEIFTTGFRLPEGVELPDSIVDPSFAKICAVIQGTYK